MPIRSYIRFANGGIDGEVLCVINHIGRKDDVQGIDNHQIVDMPIFICDAVFNTNKGEVMTIIHHYAYTGMGKTIH